MKTPAVNNNSHINYNFKFNQSLNALDLYKKGHTGQLKTLLEKSPKSIDVNAKDSSGNTLLHLACEEDDLVTIELLLKNGADIDAKNDSGEFPLGIAYSLKNFELAKLLIENNASNLKDSQGNTLVHLASQDGNVEMVRLLCNNFEDVLELNDQGFDPLYLACMAKTRDIKKKENYADIVDILLGETSEDEEVDLEDKPPLLWLACENDNPKIIEALLQGGLNPNFKFGGKSPLEKACESKNGETIELIFKKVRSYTTSEGIQILQHACLKDSNIGKETANILIEKAEFNDQEKKDLILFAYKSKNDSILEMMLKKFGFQEMTCDGLPLLWHAYQNHEPALILFLNHKADPYVLNDKSQKFLEWTFEKQDLRPARILAKSSFKFSPNLLLMACKSGFAEGVKFLIQSGSFPYHCLDQFNINPLNIAAETGNLNVMAALLTLPTQAMLRFLTAKDSSGKAPLDHARAKNHYLIASILRHTATQEKLYQAARNGTAKDLESLIQDTELKKFSGFTCMLLLNACDAKNLDTAKCLIENDCIDIFDLFNKYPEEFSIEILRCISMVNPNCLSLEDANKTTLLMCACKAHKIQIVKYLCEQGVSVEKHLREAIKAKDLETISFLREFIDPKIYIHDAIEHLPVDFLPHFLSPSALNYQASNRTPLLHACAIGKFGAVKFLLGNKADMKQVDDLGNTALHLACESGSAEIIQLLIDSGANLKAKNKNGELPLHLACKKQNVGIIKQLIKHKNQVNEKTNNQSTPLLFACQGGNLPIVELLVEQGADLYAKNDEKSNAFHIACENGNLEIVKLLAERRDLTSFLQIDANENSPLDLAIKNNRIDVVKFLIGKEVNLDDSNHAVQKNAPIFVALQGKHFEIAKLIIETKVPDLHCKNLRGENTLFIACLRSCPPEIVKLLLNENVSIKQKDKYGQLPFHFACSSQNKEIIELFIGLENQISEKTTIQSTPIHFACQGGNFEIVKLLLKYGAQLDQLTREGISCLHYAAQSDNLQLIEFLLENGLDINAKTKDGSTPLMIACQRGKVETAKYLIEKGANLYDKNSNNANAFHIACEKGHLEIIKCLNETGKLLTLFTMDAKDKYTPLDLAIVNNHIDVVRFLTEKLINLNTYTKKIKHYNDLLFLALFDNNLEIAKLLIENGYDIHQKNNTESNPLHFACKSKDAEIVKMLLDRKADLNQRDFNGELPFHYACQKQNKEIIELFISLKNQVNEKTNDQSTPIQLAYKNKNLKVIPPLLKHGANIHELFDEEEISTLHIAADLDDPDLIEFLISKKIDVDTQNKSGMTPLMFACRKNNLRAMECLINKGVSIHIRDQKGLQPIHFAAQSGHFEAVKLLLKARPALISSHATGTNDTLLMLALKSKSQDLIDYLLQDKGTDIFASSGTKDTALHVASTFSEEATRVLIQKCEEMELENSRESGQQPQKKQKITQAPPSLLKKYLNAQNAYKETPLILACKNNQLDVASLLLEKGADMNIKDWDLESPLHYAVRNHNLELVKLLIKNKINLESTNKIKEAPLHLACTLNDKAIVSLLLENGAKIDEVNINGDTPLILACENASLEVIDLLLGRKVNLEAQNSDGNAALHVACMKNESGVVEKLLKFIKPDPKNKGGMTPLHLACGRGDWESAKKLLESKADKTIQDDLGNTPLHYACTQKSAEGVQLLCEKNDPAWNTLNNNGMTPIHLACLLGHENTVNYFLKNPPVSRTHTSTKSLLETAKAHNVAKIISLLKYELKSNPEIEDKFDFSLPQPDDEGTDW